LTNGLHTVLHPRYKLDYFKKAGWLPEWIKTVEGLVCQTFDRFYASDGDTDRFTPKPAKQSGPPASNMFDELPAFAIPKSFQADDELASYLRTETEFVKDVLQWWHSKAHIYPRLSRMAVDHLTIPGRFKLNLSDATRSLTCTAKQHLLMLSESSAKVVS
jgi:hypothetical protein